MIKTTIKTNSEKINNAIKIAKSYLLKHNYKIRSKGMINYKEKVIFFNLYNCQNNDETNFVIKHELAHAVLFEYGLAEKLSRENREFLADMLAYKFLKDETKRPEKYLNYVRNKHNIEYYASIPYEKLFYMIEEVVQNEPSKKLYLDNYKYNDDTLAVKIANAVTGSFKKIGQGLNVVIFNLNNVKERKAGVGKK